MVNYSQGKIYQIVPISDGLEGEVYIGSTTKTYLSQRFTKHRSNYKRWLSGKCSNISVFRLFEKYGVAGCMITLIESVNCGSRDELTTREAFHMRSMSCVNKSVPGGKYGELRGDLPAETASLLKRKRDQEYREENKAVIAIKKKKYNEENKEVIAIRKRKYREENKADIAIYKRKYSQENKADIAIYQRKYSEENKENIAIRSKKYNEENKHQIAFLRIMKRTSD